MSVAKTRARVRGRDQDAGDTLVEILISVAILGIVGAALIGGFLTAITTSSDYRGVASSDTVLRTAVDTVTSQMQQNASAAFACPKDSSIYTVTDLPTRYSSQETSLSYWVKGAAQTTCSAQAPQLITLAVTYTSAAGKSSTNRATFAVNDPQAAPVTSGSGASKLVFLSQGGPSNSTAGSAFPNQPLVAVENSSGQIVTSDLSAMSLSITPGSGTAGATLKTCTGSEFYGVVNFSGCEIDVAGTGYTLTATDGSLTATSSPFNVSPGPPAQLVFTQSPGPASQAGTDSSAFTDEPIVAVEDAYANIVTSDTSQVSLSITAGTGTAGATLGQCTANPLNASAGLAAFTGCGINKPGSSYTLTATDSSDSLTSLPSAAFTIVLGSPNQLVFTTEPVVTRGTQAGTGESAFTNSGASDGQQPVVTIEDAAGNTLTSDTSTVTLQITSNVGPNGSVLTCSSNNVAATAGVATFSGCKINTAASGYTLTATDSSDSLPSSTSSPFSIGVGPAAQLAFTTQPVTSAGAQAGTDAGAFTISGASDGQQPVVTIEDAGGNAVTSNTSSVTLAITSGTGTSGASLSCTTNPLGASAGVATFSGCGINKPGSGYTLKATDGSLTSATSINFSIGTGPATKLGFTQSPVNTAGAQAGTGGIAWSQQPIVTIEDAKGYTVTSNTSSVTLAITSGTGAAGATLSCTPNPEPALAGVATFSGCAINTAASGYTLTATDGSLTSATSLSFKIAVGPAAQLVFSTEPPSPATKSTYFSTSVTVKDAGGNAVASSSVSLSITSGTGKSNATLTCTTNPVTSNSSGVAGFSCEINKDSPTSPSNPYTLTATDGSATGTSSSFTVTG